MLIGRKKQEAAVLAAMATDPLRGWYGLEIMEATGLASGVVYPVLMYLRAEGRVFATRETIAPPNRLQRTYYTLTERGHAAAGGHDG